MTEVEDSNRSKERVERGLSMLDRGWRGKDFTHPNPAKVNQWHDVVLLQLEAEVQKSVFRFTDEPQNITINPNMKLIKSVVG